MLLTGGTLNSPSSRQAMLSEGWEWGDQKCIRQAGVYGQLLWGISTFCRDLKHLGFGHNTELTQCQVTSFPVVTPQGLQERGHLASGAFVESPPEVSLLAYEDFSPHPAVPNEAANE